MIELTAFQSEVASVTLELNFGVLVRRGFRPRLANTSVCALLGANRRSYQETFSKPLLSAFRTAGRKCKAAPVSLFSFTGVDWTGASDPRRSEEHTSELQSQSNLVCRLLLEK